MTIFRTFLETARAIRQTVCYLTLADIPGAEARQNARRGRASPR
ncbi:hypothetical protein [Albidovulum inexpectatum]|nr:hypothetical protein [Albidovulum inexpectatum]